MGFPVALKLLSTILTHKSAAGGVALNLADADAVRAAFHAIASAASRAGGPQAFRGVAVQPMIATSPACELILGSAVDVQLGPALVVGAGGVFAEILHDRALELPPVSLDLARHMILGTNVAKVLRRIRAGEMLRIDDVARTVAALSDAAADNRRIQAIDINPFIVGADSAIAVDARVVLFPAEVPDGAIPLPAIHPYVRSLCTGRLISGSAIGLRDLNDRRSADRVVLKCCEGFVHLRGREGMDAGAYGL
jgi:acetyltransferase